MSQVPSAIHAAIEPLRAISVQNALAAARGKIAEAHADLEKHDYNLASACRHESFGEVYYIPNEFYERITRPSVDKCSFTRAEFNQRKPDLDSETRFLKETEETANFEFDKYITKMESKVGEVQDAELSSVFSSGIWSHSVLTVTQNGEKFSWRTQQIINVSKLGKLFNQWPTRKIKTK